jgi:hypothetical protein
MATYYVLPPRAVIGDRLADVLSGLLPGVTWDGGGRARLAEVLLEALQELPGVYVLSRDDLPTGAATEPALVDGFGAAAGDDVVEVRPAARAGEFASRRWRIASFAEHVLS